MHNRLVGSIDVIALKEPLWSIVSIISELHSPQVLTHSAFKESEKTKTKQEIRQKGHHFIETLHLPSDKGKHIKTSPSHSWRTYFIHRKLLQALNCINSDAERGRQKSSVIYTWKRQSSWGIEEKEEKTRIRIRSLRSWTVFWRTSCCFSWVEKASAICNFQHHTVTIRNHGILQETIANAKIRQEKHRSDITL